ncbi:hypothetical protein K491DRAFT_234249 [Lophiostoma macrostomum CBS 122681]|uniref:Uncharacterized protein n=1 Tax=Lophiostoma macrostomum CBS 122681 TaxID=1314788 RepID=A0A6A6THC8_9PLEO|nr:hypothetical protein K491DRAFT_234249 [Lophiostoma macrostomum CBS 122681]
MKLFTILTATIVAAANVLVVPTTLNTTQDVGPILDGRDSTCFIHLVWGQGCTGVKPHWFVNILDLYDNNHKDMTGTYLESKSNTNLEYQRNVEYELDTGRPFVIHFHTPDSQTSGFLCTRG